MSKERRKRSSAKARVTQLEDWSVNRLTIMYFFFVDIVNNINGYVIWGWEESYERDKLGSIISGVSTFKEPLRSKRRIVCVFLVVQAVDSTGYSEAFHLSG
ncbi:hypothetical protein I79_014812 [Cricetulus griseus]|uniref:Uncharacterized protein n=1 Tax=Cricetulus griseus TaxID=10029 RepID=G3HV35_CRIGR|nr:hypothetical protein I79_014812 [Cricetulus griseus]